MDTETRDDGELDVQLVDLSAVSLEQARLRGDSALAHSVRQVLAEADAPEPLGAVGWQSAIIH